ncbi:hypothetical protein C9374_010922 [Naegleria lovaniensis]|uniref:DOMON domain-containing protein n=1 Tax=Naegleria lovaniensis TaxID=51637 RepID=A0AA88GEY0_NAELO|nr:uncharacterized protein C9374_010922 [Naegleria lovaniensis]KAG2374352.1 hypothetical protein C9374_010922 [Naegleria lovaniensis]
MKLVVLLLVAAALCFAVSNVTAQNLNFTNCIAVGGHVFQWSIFKGGDNQNYIRARLIYQGGYSGWGAVGFRYGRDYELPYDPDNGEPLGKMGSDKYNSHIYLGYRNPNTDAHGLAEYLASSNTPPRNAGGSTTTTSIVRTAVKGAMHIYFERRLVLGVAQKFDFNASRTDADLLIAGSNGSPILSPSNLDDNNKHNFARLVKINIASASSDGSCNGMTIPTDMPAARAIVVPSTNNEPQNPPQQEASSMSRVAFVLYVLGGAVLALLIGKF